MSSKRGKTPQMKTLEQKINYTFKNENYLHRALCHSSYTNENKLEEGSNEEKSIIFKNNENNIDIIFNLTSIPTNVASVSPTNIRLSSPNVTFGKNSPQISDFKNKLNSALLNIRNTLKEKHM